MRLDVSLLPALAATFMLVFARIGAMVMLLPGFGETNIPVRIKLGIALMLTLVILPAHRGAYQIDMQSMSSLIVLAVHEIVIGIVLGATARVTLAALQTAGSVIAQQLGLGFVTAIDPTQGQQGLLIGNFLTLLGVTLLFATDSHHLVIAAGQHQRRPGDGQTVIERIGGVRRQSLCRHAAARQLADIVQSVGADWGRRIGRHRRRVPVGRRCPVSERTLAGPHGWRRLSGRHDQLRP